MGTTAGAVLVGDPALLGSADCFRPGVPTETTSVAAGSAPL